MQGESFHRSCVIKRPSPQGRVSGAPHSSRQLHPGFSPAALLCSSNTAQGPRESRSFPSFLSAKPAPRPGSNEPSSSLQEGVFQFRESRFLFVLLFTLGFAVWSTGATDLFSAVSPIPQTLFGE